MRLGIFHPYILRINKMSGLKWILGLIFIASVVALVFSLANPRKPVSYKSPTAVKPHLMPKAHRDIRAHSVPRKSSTDLTTLISLSSSILSLLGFVLAWKKDRRDAKLAALEREKMQFELMQMKQGAQEKKPKPRN
jgi:hypothetical protein